MVELLDYADEVGLTSCKSCAQFDLNAKQTSDGQFCHCLPGYVTLTFAQARQSPLASKLSQNRVPASANKLRFWCVPCPIGAACQDEGQTLRSIGPFEVTRAS